MSVTEEALAEAENYVERSLKSQTELGYSRPPEHVIRRAVVRAAHAIDQLLRLREREE